MVIAVLFFHDTIVWNIAIALISVIGVYEMLHSTKYVKNPSILLMSLVFSAWVPFSNLKIFHGKISIFLSVYLVLMILVLFRKHETVKFEQVAYAFTASVLVPFGLSSFIFIRDAFGTVALYYILLVFICAWVSDGGAYFAGVFFGKHKLAPNISPKKTIEGAVGGVLVCVLLSIAYTYIYEMVMEKMGVAVTFSLLPLLLIALIGSLIGICGDLFASILKRQTKIKDFGNLIPGHGGVLDRFDSVLFIAPYIYMVTQYVTIIAV